MKSLFDSLVRTYVPWLVGVVVGWLVSLGIPLDPEVEVQLTLVLVTAAAFLYYFLARIFELYVSPKLGWLVGLPKQPVYGDRAELTSREGDGESAVRRDQERRPDARISFTNPVRRDLTAPDQ